MQEPTLIRRRLFLLPVSRWILTTPLPIEDASLRFDAAMYRMERQVWGRPRRIIGGVAFGVVRYSVVLREWPAEFSNSEGAHNPGAYDGQMMIRGSVREIEEGSLVTVILLPGLAATLLLVAGAALSTYLFVTTHDAVTLIFFGIAWLPININFFFLESEACSYVAHGFHAS